MKAFSDIDDMICSTGAHGIVSPIRMDGMTSLGYTKDQAGDIKQINMESKAAAQQHKIAVEDSFL